MKTDKLRLPVKYRRAKETPRAFLRRNKVSGKTPKIYNPLKFRIVKDDPHRKAKIMEVKVNGKCSSRNFKRPFNKDLLPLREISGQNTSLHIHNGRLFLKKNSSHRVAVRKNLKFFLNSKSKHLRFICAVISLHGITWRLLQKLRFIMRLAFFGKSWYARRLIVSLNNQLWVKYLTSSRKVEKSPFDGFVSNDDSFCSFTGDIWDELPDAGPTSEDWKMEDWM